MPSQSKDKSLDQINNFTFENYDFLVSCLFNYMSSNELQDFADYIKDESNGE